MNYRILFVLTPPFDPNSGGVQRTTYKLGKYFTEKGHDVGYFSFAEDGHIECEYGELFYCQENGVTENQSNIKYLEEICARFRPDFVINQMPYEYPITDRLGTIKSQYGFVLLGCLRNSLFSVVNNIETSMKSVMPGPVFSMFNNPIGKKIALKRHKYLHRKSLRHIISNHDRYILLAPPNRDELKYFVGDFMEHKILSIPNSIPGVCLQVPKKNKTILHVGRLTKTQKRSELLLPFWKACKDRLPGWEFIIVGDGPYKAEMQKQIESENIERVTLTGFQKPEEYYKKASIFMMPSAYEGFPNTILEAHSFGCPVFAFNSYAALDWIVNDGKDAYLIEPYVVQKMANETVLLAKSGEKLSESQKKALHNAGRFTVDKVGGMWGDLFYELIADKQN